MGVFRGIIESLPEDIKKQTNIILTYGNYEDKLSEEDLRELPNLKWIQVLSSGTEQLPVSYLMQENILVTSVRGIHSIPISEYVFGMMLYFSKKINEFNIQKKEKNWAATIELIELYGKTVGILGTGHIGKEVAKKAKSFGMKTVGVNRSGGEIKNFDQIYTIENLSDVIGDFDYICSVLPSNSWSQGLVNRSLINRMKDGVTFINVGRGDLIVESDFLEALQTQKIRWAALDVFNEEPLDRKHPFWMVENLVMTPHASSITNMYLVRSLDIFFKNYKYFIDNDINSIINRLI
jgi:phosphoglycerate dehydrogenase-like enzyme